MNEVYIDGCNVAECEFYDRYNYTTCQIGIQNYIDCDKNPNCYYKQLQRAKAEIIKLKNEEWDNYYFASCVKSNFEGARGATEEALKRKNIEDVLYYVRIADMYLHFREDTIKREIKEKNNKYKQALEEISEIAYTTDFDIVDIQKIVNEVLQ